jgi:amino acid adenylation domain-containing protein
VSRVLSREAVAAAARAFPRREAVWAGGAVLSYGELWEQSECVAGKLREAGVSSGERVALSVPRDLNLVPLILGILGAGAAFVPLEFGQPPARARFVCEEAGTKWLVASDAAAVDLGLAGLARLDPSALLSDPAPARLPPPASSHSLAYVMFTSGSTGRPKGVAVSHGGLANLVGWGLAELGPERLRHTVLSTSLSFDVAMFEIFVPLAAGGCVYLVEGPFDIPSLPAEIAPTLYSMVPSVAAELVHDSRLRPGASVVLAGEQVPAALVLSLMREGAAEVWNCYGPTEATVYATFARLGTSNKQPPIGVALAGTRAHILGPSLEPVEPGVAGELFLAGAGVAQGYINQPALTAERFLPEPGFHGSRMYRTGDVVRRRDDDQLEFLGRDDDQLKVKGVRVEPAEIESALLRHEAVSATVVGRYDPEAGPPIIVAYVRQAAETTPSQEELLDHLRSELAPEMMPARVVILDELPRTLTGKVDRRALPAPPEERRPAVAWERSPYRLVAEAWASVLERGIHFGPDDNFFDIGGHSFLLLRLKAELTRRSGQPLRLVDMFRYPTVRSMGVFLNGEALAAPVSQRAQPVAGDRLARVQRARAGR